MALSALKQDVLNFDRCLNKPYLATLSLREAKLLLEKVGQFLQQASTQILLHDKMDGLSTEERIVWVTGYRICVDLSEEIQMKIIDLLQEREQEVQLLNSKLRQNLQDRFLATKLLQTVQQVKEQQITIANTVGIETAI